MQIQREFERRTNNGTVHSFHLTGCSSYAPFQPGSSGSWSGDHPERDGPNRGEGVHKRGQRRVHHDPGRRVVRPDGQRRRTGHPTVRQEPLLASQV